MGYVQSTYVGYGAPVLGWTNDLMERLETADLHDYEGVGFLWAGPYDNDMLFFGVFIQECELGEYIQVDEHAQKIAHLWDVCITRMAHDFGFELAHPPTWFVVSDYS